MCGPYRFVEKILPNGINPAAWDGRMAHNPTVLRYGNRFLLYYIGTTYREENPRITDHDRTLTDAIYQRIRIGVAIADSPAGPWKTLDHPVLEPRPGHWDHQIVTNPAPCVLPDGRIYLYYRSNTPEGLRIGLAVADPAVIAKLTIGKQATDVHTATLNQAIVSEYLDRGLLDPSLARNIPLYKQKKDAMIAAIRRYFPASVRYTDPQGGLFIWVELPEGVSAKDLFPKAVERKVAYVCGSDFYADGSGENTLRLNFSNATLEQIDTGIARLGELLRQII